VSILDGLGYPLYSGLCGVGNEKVIGNLDLLLREK
jgi:hypothetical protein